MRNKRASVAICAALVVAQTLFVPSQVTSARETNHSDCWRKKATERAFARRINRARERNGRSQLRADPELAKAARSHTQGMARKDNLYHTPGDRLGRKVTNWIVLGENVGVGNDVAELHRAFMDSPEHRENVLYSSYTYVGVGVIERGGRMWVTVTFESRSDPGTRQRMPRC
jgi:uncharacterized protein YkwD